MSEGREARATTFAALRIRPGCRPHMHAGRGLLQHRHQYYANKPRTTPAVAQYTQPFPPAWSGIQHTLDSLPELPFGLPAGLSQCLVRMWRAQWEPRPQLLLQQKSQHALSCLRVVTGCCRLACTRLATGRCQDWVRDKASGSVLSKRVFPRHVGSNESPSTPHACTHGPG